MQEMGSSYYVPESIQITVLAENDLVWFTDEPRQMYALAEIGLFRAYGNVIVGGLGLGLIHHFLRSNPNITRILTIERAQEQQTLVWPYVNWGELIIGDFYDVLPVLSKSGFDAQTIITDFIFGYQTDMTWEELKRQRQFCQKHFPTAQFLEHGYQRRIDAEAVNAAVFPSRFLPSDVMFDQVKIVR